jgi:hypothetical protein
LRLPLPLAEVRPEAVGPETEQDEVPEAVAAPELSAANVPLNVPVERAGGVGVGQTRDRATGEQRSDARPPDHLLAQ